MAEEPGVLEQALGGLASYFGPSGGFGRGVRELYAVELSVIGGAAALYGTMGPIEGTGWVVGMAFGLGRVAATPVYGYARAAWVDRGAIGAADIDGGETIFRRAAQLGAQRGMIGLNSDAGALVVLGPFEQAPRGRWMGIEIANLSAMDAVATILLVWERCSASPGEAAAGRGACWG